MEFLLVPIIFAGALLMLGVGKLFGGKQLQNSCAAGKHVHGTDHDDSACGCNNDDVKFYLSKDDPGLDKVASLGYPNRKKRFIDKLDFKPDRFN